MAAEPGLRITSVTVSRLFGIPDRLEVSFLPLRSERPASAIIFGENGSGKSSIAKAIEWAAQNRVNRSAVGRRSPRSLLLNVADKRTVEGHVTVTLSDGYELSRQAIWDAVEQRFAFTGPDPTPSFTHSPIVLTRADVLEFVNNAPAARGKVFLDYELDPSRELRSTSAHSANIHHLDQEVLDYKRQIRESVGPIAEHLDRPAPYDISQITAMIDDLYKGAPRNQRHRIRIPRKLEPIVTHIAELQRQLAAASKERDKVRRLAEATAPRRIAELKATLGDIDDWLTSAFREVTSTGHVKQIQIKLGESSASAVDIRIHTISGASFDEKILSEGYQDLLAMLFFLATSRVSAAHGQVQILVLDDVLQSVDAHIRVALMQFVLREFKDWQLIVTVHDRLWREQLHKLFQDRGMQVVSIELRDWSFDSGARVDQPVRDPSAALRAVCAINDPAAISALAGRLLEQICDTLSWTIPVRVQRRREDLYTLEDLWQGVASALRISAAGPVVQDLEGHRHLRNLVGAHHNEWAQTVTAGEALRFAQGVLDLFGHAWCTSCGGWVQQAGRGTLRCSCGLTELKQVKIKG